MSDLLNVLLHSGAVRKLIYSRSLEYNIPLRYLCLEAGIDYMNFMRSYINSNSGKAKITEEQFIKILDILGIDVRYQFVINEKTDVTKARNELAEKYKNL